jgi:hypothetical protein
MLEVATLDDGVRLGDVVAWKGSLSCCELREAKLVSQWLAADRTRAG